MHPTVHGRPFVSPEGYSLPSQVIGTLQPAAASSLVWSLNRLTFLLQLVVPIFDVGGAASNLGGGPG